MYSHRICNAYECLYVNQKRGAEKHWKIDSKRVCRKVLEKSRQILRRHRRRIILARSDDRRGEDLPAPVTGQMNYRRFMFRYEPL